MTRYTDPEISVRGGRITFLIARDEPGSLRACALLVVSHRPAVLARADQLVVLEDGRRTG